MGVSCAPSDLLSRTQAYFPVLLLFGGDRLETKLWSPQVTERVVFLLLRFLFP